LAISKADITKVIILAIIVFDVYHFLLFIGVILMEQLY